MDCFSFPEDANFLVDLEALAILVKESDRVRVKRVWVRQECRIV